MSDLGDQTNAEWVARLDVPRLLSAAKSLVETAQNLAGPNPNGYAAASAVQHLGEFLTLYAKPWHLPDSLGGTSKTPTE